MAVIRTLASGGIRAAEYVYRADEVAYSSLCSPRLIRWVPGAGSLPQGFSWP